MESLSELRRIKNCSIFVSKDSGANKNIIARWFIFGLIFTLLHSDNV